MRQIKPDPLGQFQLFPVSAFFLGDVQNVFFADIDDLCPVVFPLALDERALKFLNTYAENFIIIDFKELNKGRIDEEVAEFFNPVVLIPIERYYVAQMAEIRNHSLDERRYMWKVEY